MRTLLLLRHAKSDQGQARLDDFDRPLAPRGRKAASRMGAWLADHRLFPAVALVSSARRAQETWDLVAPHAGADAGVRRDRALYLATPGEILAVLGSVEPTAGCVLMVGHNPGFELLAQMLSGPGSDATAVADLARGYPTAGLAVFETDAGSWADLVESAVRLTAFVRPRELD
jgi:phosphohistidine phosphatase